MNPDRPNIFFMDRKIKSCLRIGLVEFQTVLSYHVIISNIDKELILIARWLRLKCEELGSRYRMPSRAEIAKMGGDDDREDKERVMAGFLSGSVNVR